jgi:hypothetical protein
MWNVTVVLVSDAQACVRIPFALEYEHIFRRLVGTVGKNYENCAHELYPIPVCITNMIFINCVERNRIKFQSTIVSTTTSTIIKKSK